MRARHAGLVAAAAVALALAPLQAVTASAAPAPSGQQAGLQRVAVGHPTSVHPMSCPAGTNWDNVLHVCR